MSLKLEPGRRQDLLKELVERIEGYHASVSALPVHPHPSRAEVRERLARFDFTNPLPAEDVMNGVERALRDFQLHTAHPNYYGVFNPNPSFMGILGDILAAVYNPQLASSASSLYCIEVENLLLRFFAGQFGYQSEMDGIFTSGGTEANLSALLCALQTHLPRYTEDGLGAAKPVIYTSSETHHSIKKAAKAAGLGLRSVRTMPVSPDLQFDVAALERAIDRDKKEGFKPLMIVGTVGTTSAGTVDPIAALASVAGRHQIWFHVDAAWGGAAVLLPEHRALFTGCELADSITVDAHKWLSVPMGCSFLLTRHPGLLRRTFQVEESPYMPPATFQSKDTQPYMESLQWSRRAMGLKLFMTLATAGLSGYQDVLRNQIRMGERLRELLKASDWEVVNSTPLPVICFKSKNAEVNRRLQEIADRIGRSGRAWITTTKLTNHEGLVLRAGISNFATEEVHLHELTALLGQEAALLRRRS